MAGRRLSHAGWVIAITAAYLYLFPHFPAIHSANELPRIYLIKAMVHDHTFAIDKGVARWGTTVDVSPSNGHLYANKSPGSSMLVVPIYAAISAVAGEPSLPQTLWIARVVGGVIPSVVFLILLSKFLARYAPNDNVRRLVVMAYALGSMAMTYTLLFISHQLSAICVASAWMLALDAAERKRGLGALAAAGFLVGCAPLVDYQAAFAVVPIAIHVLVKLWAWPRKELVRAVVIVALAAAIPIAVLLAYHDACFGSPLRTGYNASTTFAMYHQQGFLGITKLRWEAFVGSTVAPHFGLFALTPWLLLWFPGSVCMWRRGHKAEAITCAAIVAIYLLFISSINFWRGGWSVGPRYIVVMIPFMLPAIATLLESWRDRWLPIALSAGAMLVGVVVFCLASATFPYWPEAFRNPVPELVLRLFAEGHLAPNAGTAIGLSGIVSVVPFLLIVAGLIALPIQRLASWRGLAVAGVTAIVLTAAFRLFPATRGVEEPYQRVVAAMTRSATR